MLEELNKRELLDLIKAYNDYVMEYFEEHSEGNPVCIEEFYNNEYQEMGRKIIPYDTSYLRQKFIQNCNVEMAIYDILDLCDQQDLEKYIVNWFRENFDFEEFRETFDDLDNEEFIDFMNDYMGFDMENLEDYDNEDKDYSEEIDYYNDIINDYEIKGRGDKKTYQWALQKLAEIKSKIADDED